MDERMTAALATVRGDGRRDEKALLEACIYLIEHRDALPYRIFIDLPGGMSGNADPKWERVKSLTESRCNCGNERTIMPLNPRTEYARSETPPKGYFLAQLAAALSGQKAPAVMYSGKGKAPLFAIESADPVAGTMTVVLDKDVEVFDPESWKDRHA